jgi:mannose-6-phosphate isomerase-like protein (cupin superfamily)
MDAVIRGPGEGDEIALGPTIGHIKAGAEHTGGRFALTESTFAAGFQGPLPHLHREMHDCFYVVEGTLRFLVGGETVDAGPGTFVVVPPGVVHTFSNPTDAPARVLNIFAPAGLEGYLRELSALPGPPTPEAMAGLASRYDFELPPG